MGMIPIINWTVTSKHAHQMTAGDTAKLFWIVDCTYDIGDWIESNDASEWKIQGQYHQGKYWVSEQLLTMLAIKFPRRDIVHDQYL